MSNALENQSKKEPFNICQICETIFVEKRTNCNQCGFDILEEINLVEALDGITLNLKKIQAKTDDKYEIQELEGLITQTESFKKERENTYSFIDQGMKELESNSNV